MHCTRGGKHVSLCAFSANATAPCNSTSNKWEEPSSRCCLAQATASSGCTHFSSRHPKNSGINTSDKCTKDRCTHTNKPGQTWNNNKATIYTNIKIQQRNTVAFSMPCFFRLQEIHQVSRPKPLLPAVPESWTSSSNDIPHGFDVDFQTESSAAIKYGHFGE